MVKERIIMSNTELIKELRALTQAGMKDCKDALEEAGWDVQKAVDIVKVKGLNVVSGREGKVAADGVVSTFVAQTLVSMVEVNCQTDFVANSPDFRKFADITAFEVYQSVVDGELFDAKKVEKERQDIVSTTKENVVVRRWWVEEVADPRAQIFTYIHSNSKIGVMLTLLAPTVEAARDSAFIELGNDLAMQVAAMGPLAVTADKLDPEVVARQKTIFETQLEKLNKPQAAWAKILEGKFNKWYTEVCLLNQESVVVAKMPLAQHVLNVGYKLGGTIEVVSFTRCQVGEGIEVVKENLADEIAKMV